MKPALHCSLILKFCLIILLGNSQGLLYLQLQNVDNLSNSNQESKAMRVTYFLMVCFPLRF